jgi:hypothetical protein
MNGSNYFQVSFEKQAPKKTSISVVSPHWQDFRNTLDMLVVDSGICATFKFNDNGTEVAAKIAGRASTIAAEHGDKQQSWKNLWRYKVSCDAQDKAIVRVWKISVTPEQAQAHMTRLSKRK